MPETWMDELTKLGEKMVSFANAKMVANASTHNQHQLVNNQQKKKKDAQLGNSRKQIKGKKDEEEGSRSSTFNYRETCTLSESTICLLLDRFVPS